VFTPAGRHYYLQTRLAQTETIEALIEQGLPFLPVFDDPFITFMEPRVVGVSETAFALRQDHLMER